MAKITKVPTEYTLTISEEERLALLAGLRYRSSHSGDEAQHHDTSVSLIDILSGA